MNRQRAIQITYFLLRVVAGILIFDPGAMKMFGWFGGMPGAHGAAPPVMSQIWIGGILEVVGGIAILLGVATRPIAFILSGEMAVAYWQFHAQMKFMSGLKPIVNHGEPAVLLCFIFLYIAAQGGGDWSIDALIKGRRGTRAVGPASP